MAEIIVERGMGFAVLEQCAFECFRHSLTNEFISIEVLFSDTLIIAEMYLVVLFKVER